MVGTCPLAQSRLTKTIVNDIVFKSFANTIGSRSAFNLEKDMIKPPTTLTRRSAFRVGAGLAAAARGTALLPPPPAPAGAGPPARAAPPTPDGRYLLIISGLRSTAVSAG